MKTVVRGLNDILSGGTEFLTFEEGKAKDLLFVDWYEDLVGIREHYEPSLNPKYVRCPGKDVCPLCAANPGKYPAFRVKFRVYDPTDNKVKMVSLAKKHIQALNKDFNLDDIDPTKEYVTVYREGKDAQNTLYSARRAKKQYDMPNWEELDMPDLTAQVTPHTPQEIQGFMNALIASAAAGAAGAGANTGHLTGTSDTSVPQGQPATQRKLPF